MVLREGCAVDRPMSQCARLRRRKLVSDVRKGEGNAMTIRRNTLLVGLTVAALTASGCGGGGGRIAIRVARAVQRRGRIAICAVRPRGI